MRNKIVKLSLITVVASILFSLFTQIVFASAVSEQADAEPNITDETVYPTDDYEANDDVAYLSTPNGEYDITMKVGESRTLQNHASSIGMSFYAYTWFSDNNIVSVPMGTNSRTNTVTAVKAGTATVTTYLDGSIPQVHYGTRYNSITKRWETYSWTTYTSKSYMYVYNITVVGTPGDLNGDDIVNITDAIELLKYVAKLDNNVVYEASADIDGNGTVNINDAIALLKQIAGL